MVGYTKVILIGNLTRDPELRTLPNGTLVAEIGMACNRRYTQGGEQKEQTCFIDVRFYGRQAEVIEQYLRKGNPLFVEGRLEFASWTAQDGSRRSKHRVVGEAFQFLGGRQGEREGGGRSERPGPARPGPDGGREERAGRYRGGAQQGEGPGAEPDRDAPEPMRYGDEQGFSEAGPGEMEDVPF